MNKFELKPSGELSYGKERCRGWAQHGMFGHGHLSHNEIPYTGYRKTMKNHEKKSSIDGLMPIHNGNTRSFDQFCTSAVSCSATKPLWGHDQGRYLDVTLHPTPGGDVPSGKHTKSY